MNFKKFGTVVLILGIVVLLYGGFQFVSNSHLEKATGPDWKPNYGGRAGEQDRIEEENSRRIDNRNEAVMILVAGGIMAFVGGLSMSHLSNKKE